MTSTTSAPRGKPYRYYSCTQVRRRGRGECPIRAVSAAELERFVVDRIRDIGRDPTVLQETLAAIDEQRVQERPALEQEQRSVSVRLRSGENLGTVSLDALIERLRAENEPSVHDPAGEEEHSWSSRCC